MDKNINEFMETSCLNDKLFYFAGTIEEAIKRK